MNPRISVVIPAHNEEKYIEKTLQSLRQQNFLDYETIVVCNGCTDNTQKVAEKYLNQNTKIISLEKANVGCARNAGAEKAIGEILLFLDADTSLEPTTLQIISQNFVEDVSIATTKTKPDISKTKYKLATFLKNLYNQTGIYNGCSGALICKKEDFHSVGGYPELSVKEQRKLVVKLKKLGGYKVINTNSITSMRRFEQWGLSKAICFWLKQWIKGYTSDLVNSDYEKVR